MPVAQNAMPFYCYCLCEKRAAPDGERLVLYGWRWRLPVDLQVVEQDGALATRSRVLEHETTVAERSYLSRNVDLLRQVLGLLGQLRGGVGRSRQGRTLELDGQRAVGAEAGRGDGLGERRYYPIFILYEQEINRIAMLCGANQTQRIARQGARIELQADVHILTRGRAEALAGGLGGGFPF